MVKQQITRVGAYGLITQGSDVLLCRLSSQVKGYAGYWTLPGGGMEFGEHPEQTVVREVAEETGLSIKASALLGIDSLTREVENEAFHSVRVIYEIEVLGGEIRFELDGTTDRCEWHPVKDVPDLKLVSLVEVGMQMAGFQD
jgi:8-oxo-dGTP diphosphatase